MTPARRRGGLWDELEVVICDRLRDRVGSRVHGDLQLLPPQLRLPPADLVMQLVALVAELQILLAQLQQAHGDQRGGREANQKLQHGKFPGRSQIQFALAVAFAGRRRRMLGWTVSPPLRMSLFSSLSCVQALPLPSCSAAIFQRLSLSLTVYHPPGLCGCAGAGRGSTRSVTGTAPPRLTGTVSGIDSKPPRVGAGCGACATCCGGCWGVAGAAGVAGATATAGIVYLRPSTTSSGFFCSDGLSLMIASRFALLLEPRSLDAI